MSSIKEHLSGYKKRLRKADIEASVSKHPKISSFFSAASCPLVTADQFPSEPSGSSSAADNAATVATHHVCDVSSAVVHTEAPPCIEESFQVLARPFKWRLPNAKTATQFFRIVQYASIRWKQILLCGVHARYIGTNLHKTIYN